MSSSPRHFEETRTESAAVALMRMTVAKYAQMHGVPYEEALERFIGSDMYDELFDFDLRYWAEGPDYLLDLWNRREQL